MDRKFLLHAAETALESSQAEQTQVSVHAGTLHVTRFNNNLIHQSLSRDHATLAIKVLQQNRVGVATTNRLTEDAIVATAKQALLFANLQQPNPNLVDLPDPLPIPEVDALIPSTARCSAQTRADIAKQTIDIARSAGLNSSGTVSTQINQDLVLNSNGIEAYHASSQGFYRTIMTDGEITGYADRVIKDIDDLDVQQVAQEAKQKATLFQRAYSIEPGTYTTVFTPVAVADLIRFLGYTSFGAAAKQEGRSFMATKLGQKVMDSSISIGDDAYHPEGLLHPFDREGVPKKAVKLIDQGVAVGVVYDTQTAHKEGKQSTGHASGYGPSPSHMVMAAGDMPLEEMIKTTQRGILVTRFHYTHCPDPMQVIATGTTRDGTFLIEDGEIVARLKNLRFTDSILSAFSSVSGISPDRRLARDWWSSFISLLPALRVDKFNFTGTTTF